LSHLAVIPSINKAPLSAAAACAIMPIDRQGLAILQGTRHRRRGYRSSLRER
jgi:hypothetical protein